MLSKQYSNDDDSGQPSYIYDSRIKRLQSTLKGRINLLNIIKSLIYIKYIPLNMQKLKIDLNNEDEISKYIEDNNKYIEEVLSKDFESVVFKSGSNNQIKRLLEHNKKKGRVE